MTVCVPAQPRIRLVQSHVGTFGKAVRSGNAADSSANYSNPHCCPLESAIILADALKQSVLGGTANMTLPFLKAFYSRQIFVNQL